CGLPKSTRSLSSALIIRLLAESCRLFFLMYSQIFLTTSVRGTALSPMTAASSGLGVLAAMNAAFGLRAGFFAAALAAGFLAAALAAGLRAAGFLAAAFVAAGLRAAAFLAAGFLAAGFLAATFLAATFLAAGFLAAGFFAAAFLAGWAAVFLAAGLRAAGFFAAGFLAAAFFAAGLAATFFAAGFLAAVFFAPLAVAMDHPPLIRNDRLPITPRRMTRFVVANNRNVSGEQVLGTQRAQTVVSAIQSWREHRLARRFAIVQATSDSLEA